jgi:hypothetical protein
VIFLERLDNVLVSKSKKPLKSVLQNHCVGKNNATSFHRLARPQWVTFAQQYSYVITPPPTLGLMSFTARPRAVKPMIPRAGVA